MEKVAHQEVSEEKAVAEGRWWGKRRWCGKNGGGKQGG
jgi:hypothetical protein